jgi:hemoglobin
MLGAVSPPSTLYERVGGEPFFDDLTRRFYDGVRDEPVLAAVYPQDDEAFEQARVHLRGFLVQYFGGPATYSEQRGHPRLRMRHLPFPIGPAERDAWVRVMQAAVAASAVHGLDESRMLTYFESAAAHLVNQGGPDPAS